MTCDYCTKDIVQDTYGWGYMFDEEGKVGFHTECMEVEEGITLYG